jgi:dihydroorotate dehydrogenase
MRRTLSTRRTIALYRILRPLLFRIDAETSHHITFLIMRLLYILGGGFLFRLSYKSRTPNLPVTVMGLNFQNPIGLAAGFDKDARLIGPLADLGFSALELGTVTPRAQQGNVKLRLFRVPAQHALINRMGFNNAGLSKFIQNLTQTKKTCLIGVNIGKNRDTPVDRAVDDYLSALRSVYMHADYVAVNVSSPNTPGLRTLQEKTHLDVLLRELKTEQVQLAKARGVYVPIALKIAPDLNDDQIAAIAQSVLEHRFDAVIATNTTLSRHGLDNELLAREEGGLSGRPLKALSTDVIRKLFAQLQGRVPIIGVGGIESAQDAWEKLVAGADLVQLYTGLIYHGPDLVRSIVRGLVQRVRSANCQSLNEAVLQARAGAYATR